MAKKPANKNSDSLHNAARAIGSALGSLTATATHTADSLAEKAKSIQIPTGAQAKSAVGKFLASAEKSAKARLGLTKKSATAKKKPAAKPAAKKTAKKKK